MTNHNHEVKFAEIELGEEEAKSAGMSIPPRPEAPEQDATREEVTATPVIQPVRNYPTGEQRFLDRAKQMEDHVEPETPFVPFMTYWPTYSNMDAAQTKWYYYWRSEVRSGRYPETDLSYIFLYIYELINGVGWQEPMEGYRSLLALWDAYRSQYAKLNFYIVDWIADFILVHRLDISFQEMMCRSTYGLNGELLDLELMRGLYAEPVDVSWDMLQKLSNYNVQQSKYYTGDGGVHMETHIPRVVALVDAYYRKTQGCRLIELFKPGREVQRERYLFGSAVYDTSLYGRTLTVHTVQFSEHKLLRDWVTQLIRYCENQLRELSGYKGKLRGIHIDAALEPLITRAIKAEFERRAAMDRVESEVQIDRDRLQQLQRDSDHVRELLTVEEEPVREPERCVENGTGDDVAVVAANSGAYETSIEAPLSDESIAAVPSFPTQTPDSEPIDRMQLDDSWQAFRAGLTPAYRAALSALVRGSWESDMFAIAREHNTMPALIIDGMNDLAMETIGDLIVDADVLVDEYIEMLNNYVG
ncbi:TerB N-terminal domain-containing protein [Paenibacillus guangzhouensis]|uniref:TerB N-terminal domain-containing protein n=1 Tax=Paenibacillus guangzhouensis TaxID=1473112 RepID=UPI0012676A7F|nr:TerB N-terminal domain-containing protein [Paenibacillus guangzhouensis]